MAPTFTLLHAESEEVRRAIRAPLIEFNARHAGDGEQQPLLIPLRDSDHAIIGGLSAVTADDWLYIEHLFVPSRLREQGLGRRMMACAESEALARHCHSSWLGTLGFQARGFYERLGYNCFAELPDHPRGHSLYFMKKSLR